MISLKVLVIALQTVFSTY